MVIEKILKVNSTDPKVDELKARLAQLQQKTSPAPAATTPTPGATQPTPPVTAPKDDLAKLQQLSAEEQRRLAERNNPELRLKEERTNHLIMNQIKELIQLNTDATKRIKDVEAKNTELQKQVEMFKEKHEDMLQKMNTIDSRLEKFMGLYELVTNQYNPFADSQEVKMPPPRAPAPVVPAQPKPVVKSDAQVFKVEDSITQTSAAVEVKPEDQETARANFKRVEELLADLQKKELEQHAASAQSAPVTQPPPALNSELHVLLSQFEQRLQQQFDKTLQDKLHHGFNTLETSLQSEIRDALRAELEKIKQDDEEVQQALNELQALIQGSETHNRAPVEEELAELATDISRLRDEVKSLPPNLYFRVADGTILKNIQDLRAVMRTMKPEVFAYHVGNGKNHFADWVEHALVMPQLAQLLRQSPSAEAMYAAITAHDGLPN